MNVNDYLTATGGQAQGALAANGQDIPTALRLGLTVRDVFAGEAMQALVGATTATGVEDVYGQRSMRVLPPAQVAEMSYRYADAMLAERRKVLEAEPYTPSSSPPNLVTAHEQAESGR